VTVVTPAQPEERPVPVDPAIGSMLQALADMGAPSLATGDVAGARQRFSFMTTGLRDPATMARVASTEDIAVPGAAAPVRARVYRPEGRPQALPTLVFFHGGGFVIGDIDSHDDQARLLCARADVVVLSVDYRLAPEAKAPAAARDCWAATQWAVEHVAELGGDPARVAVGGDSAGGNLAALVAIAARDAGVALAAQLLLYPSVDFNPDADYPSRTDNGDGYFLTAEDMLWFAGHYLPEGGDPADPSFSPAYADLTGVAPAIIATAEFDPLRDEGEAYAGALEKAGVPVVLRRYDAMVHGFFGFGLLSPAAAEAVEEICAELASMLRRPQD